MSTATLAPPAVAPTPAPSQAAVFRQLRVRLARNGLRTLVESGKIKLVTMLATSVVVGLFVFALSWFGFHELFRGKVPAKGLIAAGLFDMMFFTLGGMLIFSTGIILYASLFTSPEAKFLLATPATADLIFATKFQAAVAFSSWAFLILGLPILVSYGIVAGVPWYFYPLLPAYLLGFVLLPGSASALGCVLLARFLPRNRRQVLLASGVVLTGVLIYWLVQVGNAAKRTLAAQNRSELDGLVGQFSLAQHPLMPSHWMTTGVTAAARDEVLNAAIPMALLCSNGLMAYLFAAWVAGRVYRTAFDRLSGQGRGKAIYRTSVLDRGMELLVWYLDKPTRILVVKDFRTFRRDPSQWALLIVFAGLMMLGARNFRQFYTADLDVLDKYIVGLVNLAGTSILLCAGLSRFIFPLISLEGRKFWVLGLMPVSRRQILVGKFAFAATGAVLIAETLIVGSELMLGVSFELVAVHALAALCIALGLSGLNVGLGAYMPNFRETDPSKIVVGFSGTVNMVVGLLYIVIVVAVTALPLHAAAVVKFYLKQPMGDFPWWAYAGLPLGVIAAAVAVWLPLRAGAKALAETEF
jgi:ABC-2 type transport system permease protein